MIELSELWIKAKFYGVHHGVITTLLFPFVGWLIVAVYFGKEFGEAIERAGGEKKAVTTWTIKSADNPSGVWEPWHAITPLINGVFITTIPKVIALL